MLGAFNSFRGRERGEAMAATVVGATLLAGERGNGELSSMLRRWLDGSNDPELWAAIDRHLDVSALGDGREFFLGWEPKSRRAAFHAAGQFTHNPEDLFGELFLACVAPEQVKKLGQVFTPSWLARRVVRDALGHWRRLHRIGGAPRLIADVSCGVGAFLPAIRETFGEEPKVLAVDMDPLCVAFSSLLGRALGKLWDTSCLDPLIPMASPLGSDSQRRDLTAEGFDILLGNPPYVRSQALGKAYRRQLKEIYGEVADGNFDLVILFIEHALRNLVPGGLASYVVSHKFMVSSYGRAICRRLASSARVVNVVDFQDSQLFDGRTTYTSVLTFAKLQPAKYFTVTRFKGDIGNSKDLGRGETRSLLANRLCEHPWSFAAGLDRHALVKLRGSRHPLLTQVFAGILQGVRTGANSIYIVDCAQVPSLEPQALLPFVSGENIRRCRVNAGERALVYPYVADGSGGMRPLSEKELRERFPRTWEYLRSHYAELSERGLDSKQPWFAYSRVQNLGVASQAKILVREMMPRVEFAVDLDGQYAFCSGYALVAPQMTREEWQLWAAVLNTPTMEFALRHNGTELHSGWFRLLKHHLQSTHLPSLSGRERTRAMRLSAILHADPSSDSVLSALDDVVARAFGLSDAERDAIRRYLADCHAKSIPEDSRTDFSPSRGVSGSASTVVSSFEPVRLSEYARLHRDRPDLRRTVTFQINKQMPVHRWYSFTQGFSEPIVVELFQQLGVSKDTTVLDPFVGCGTTLVTARRHGIPSVGIDISPFLAWVTKTKVFPWRSSELRQAVEDVETERPRPMEPGALLFRDYLDKAYAPSILAQLFGLTRWIDAYQTEPHLKDFLHLGLASIMEEVSQIRKHGSHYRFMLKTESVGLQKLNTQVVGLSFDVIGLYIRVLRDMLEDVELAGIPANPARCEVLYGDARATGLQHASVDAVVTSPPYLNRNNYVAQQKAEMSILKMIGSYEEYRQLVRRTFRSHVESTMNPEPGSRFLEVQRILDMITLSPNNNPKIPQMIAGYFDDLDATLAEMSRILRPGGKAAFVVGNSRWGGVVVPVDHLLMMLAEGHCLEPLRILVTREKGNSPQQMRRYGRIPVRESVVVLRRE